MTCPKCKNEMTMTTGDYHFTECGLKQVWLKDWPMVKCENCGEARPILPNPDVLTKVLVSKLISQGTALDGDSIFFLRKAMALTGQELANLLDVNRVEVSAWENDRRKIPEFLDFKLRMEAVDRIVDSESSVASRERAKLDAVEVLQSQYKHEVGTSPIYVERHTELVAFA